MLILSILISASAQSHNIQDYLQPVDDLTIVSKVTKRDQNELKKIKKDFGQNYRFDSVTLRYKDPFKLRVDSTVEDTTVSAIYNGVMLKISAPGAGLHTTQNLTHETARRETIFDSGILVPSLFPSFFKAKFVRIDRETNEPVFDITYSDPDEQARYRTWIDPVKKIVTRREWYNRYGTELATFYYDQPKQFKGVWIPTEIVVKNLDNNVAGATRYESVKINTGLEDSVFSTR